MKIPIRLTWTIFLIGILLLSGCSGSPLIIEISIPTSTPAGEVGQPSPTPIPIIEVTATPAPAQPTATSAPPPAQPTPTTAAANLQISIAPFPNGNEFTSPATVWVSGTTSQMPFEKTLVYKVVNASNQEVVRAPVQVSGEYGGPGTFTFPVQFDQSQTGDFTIIVFNTSPANGEVNASAETKVTIQTQAQPQMSIQIDPFASGNTFNAPVTITVKGRTNPVPFEKQMAYQVLSADNQLVDQGQVWVTGEYGGEGTFSVDIPFAQGQTGEFTIRVLDTSAKDGSVIASDEVKVTIQ